MAPGLSWGPLDWWSNEDKVWGTVLHMHSPFNCLFCCFYIPLPVVGKTPSSLCQPGPGGGLPSWPWSPIKEQRWAPFEVNLLTCPSWAPESHGLGPLDLSEAPSVVPLRCKQAGRCSTLASPPDFLEAQSGPCSDQLSRGLGGGRPEWAQWTPLDSVDKNEESNRPGPWTSCCCCRTWGRSVHLSEPQFPHL